MKTLCIILFCSIVLFAQEKDSTITTSINQELEGIKAARELYTKELQRLMYIEKYLTNLKALGYEIKKDTIDDKKPLKPKEK